MADHSSAIAPEMCGVAMDVPLTKSIGIVGGVKAERTGLPGAVMSGFDSITSIDRHRASAAKGSYVIGACIQSAHSVSMPHKSQEDR